MKKGNKQDTPKRRTLRQIHAWGMTKQPLIKATSLFIWRGNREMMKLGRTKPRRFTVGYIRAHIGPHYFAGCYHRAEFD